MTTINLRNLRQLDIDITKEADQIISPNDFISTRIVTISVHDPHPVVAYKDKQHDIKKDINTAFVLFTIKHKIRRTVQMLNEQCGVNDLLSKLAHTEHMISIYRSLLAPTHRGEIFPIEQTETRINSIMSYVMQDRTESTIHLNVYHEHEIEELKSSVVKYKQEHRELSDQILRLNINTGVEIRDILEESEVELLKHMSLV